MATDQEQLFESQQALQLQLQGVIATCLLGSMVQQTLLFCV